MTIRYDVTRFSDYDIYLFKQGSHIRLYEKMGSHMMVCEDGTEGVYFAVWAPNAMYVSVRGDFNDYDAEAHPLKVREDDSGIWEGFIPGVQKGPTYKYHIRSKVHGIVHDKADPYACFAEKPSNSASRVWNLEGYAWQDAHWMQNRHKNNAHTAPMSVYEVHLGSWRRGEENRYLGYLEMADELVAYVKEMNYTHVEFMPITEFPYRGSWGYQVTGYFAPTARFGEPHELMALIDAFHQDGIGVFIDWVPSHFAVDMHGLGNFDGTALYEHDNPQMGFHPEWGSYIFNYGRNEVRAFLISSAMFWLEYYHVDGIRVDAVASMLYLNYARKEGEWSPNRDGGNENLEAVAFLKQLNKSVYGEHSDIVMIAEESTAWPMVTRPIDVGGLGFGFKWNMGWMHDTLKYLSRDPIYREHHHHQLTFSMWYGFDENFMLPLSHDEVVHMKGSLINKMPGEYEKKFSNLRALLAYMTAHPGKKLLFMGGEIAQFAEWNYEQSLDWNLLDYPLHAGVQQMVKSLNALYRDERALHFYDEKREGFAWIDELDYRENRIAFLRKSDNEDETIAVVCNFADAERDGYILGVPHKGSWEVIFSSDGVAFGGEGSGSAGVINTSDEPMHNFEQSLRLTLPRVSILFLKRR